MKQPETNKYQDIIHLSRPRSQRHPPMSAHDRAGQFSPFAALTGFETAIAETQRLTDSRIILEEGAKELLDQRMQEILERIETQPMVQILWFRYDPRKTGGEYITHTGRVKKVDTYNRQMLFTDGSAIPLEEIFSISLL